MSESCPVFGDLSYLTVADESTYGVLDGSPAYNFVPVLSYGMELQPEYRSPDPFLGIAEEVDQIVAHSHVAGSVSMALYGWHVSPLTHSLAQYMMEWAFSSLETLCAIPSKTFEWAEGPDIANKRTLGTVVNGATLSGADDGGGAISLSLDLLGATETSLSTAQTRPTAYQRMNEFVFNDAVFSIGADSGSLAVVPIKSFNWQRQRNLSPTYNGSITPKFFRPGKPSNSFSVSFEKEDGTWDGVRRATVGNFYYGRLFLKGLHNGTGTGATNFATVQIDFPRLAFNGVKDNYTRNGVLVQNLSFGVRKPLTLATASSVQSWADAA
jgi:hypothetical protein